MKTIILLALSISPAFAQNMSGWNNISAEARTALMKVEAEREQRIAVPMTKCTAIFARDPRNGHSICDDFEDETIARNYGYQGR